MKTGNAIAGLAGMLVAVIVLWLMGVNLMGWLGCWMTPGAAWLVGVLMAAALGAGFGLLWPGIAKQPALKKLPRPVGGVLYGLIVGLLFVFVIPVVLSLLAGDPSVGLSSGTGFDVFPEAFGAHLVPALPDLGFDPPMRALAEKDWFAKDDFVGRVLPFSIAFMLFGVCVDVLSNSGK
ncbi:MAG: hypothetical protein KDB29_01820 [Planctomycetes bacterium]|nr:hypothetical protein [Planctomycetota bacterium]